MTSRTIRIRDAVIGDAPVIMQFIRELADYEKLSHEVRADVASIENTLFGADATAHAVIALVDDKPVGYAVYFYNYSTWLGKNGLYLEDLYVCPASRHVGVGKALIHHLARLAVANDCGRFEWSVLDWNEPSIRFYQSLGAKPQDEWVIYRLTGEALQAFADSELPVNDAS